MPRLLILIVVCLLLAACQSDKNTPLPTSILDLSPTPQAVISPAPTWTTVSISAGSPTPIGTPTLNAIQQTEVYLFGLRTAEAGTLLAPTLPPAPEATEPVAELLPGSDWQAYEITLTLADLASLAQQIGMNEAVVSLDGIFLRFTWGSGSDEYLLIIRQDALDGTLLITPISYQRNGAVVDLVEAAALVESLRDVILSLRKPERVSYLDAVQFGTDAYTLRFLQSPE